MGTDLRPYGIVLESMIGQYAPSFSCEFEPDQKEWIASSPEDRIVIDFTELINPSYEGTLNVCIELYTKDISIEGTRRLNDELAFGQEYLKGLGFIFKKGRAGNSDDNLLSIAHDYQLVISVEENLFDTLTSLEDLVLRMKGVGNGKEL